MKDEKKSDWSERFDKKFNMVTACIDDVCENCHKDKPCCIVEDLKQFIKNERREAQREMGESLRMEEKMLEYHRNKAKNVKSIRAKNYHRSILMAYGEFNKAINKYLEER